MTPRILSVGAEPPPLEPARNGPCLHQERTKTRKGSGDRFRVFNAFVDLALAGLTRAEIAVWLVLYRDTRDESARTSIGNIALRAGCNRATVFRALDKLKGKGLLRTLYRGGLGRGCSRYRVSGIPKEE